MCMQDFLLSRCTKSFQQRALITLAAKVEILEYDESRISITIPTLTNGVDFTISDSNDLTIAGFRIAAGLPPFTFHYLHHGSLPRQRWMAKALVGDFTAEFMIAQLDLPKDLLKHLWEELYGGYHGKRV
jgi:hypothetical protein